MKTCGMVVATVVITSVSLSTFHDDTAQAGYVYHDAESGVIATWFKPGETWEEDELGVLDSTGNTWAFSRTSGWRDVGYFDVVPLDSLEWCGNGFFITKAGDFWYVTGDPAHWEQESPPWSGVLPDLPDRRSSRMLHQNHPNPFDLSTTICVSLEESVRNARIVIHDAEGRQVRTIPVGDLQPMEGRLKWDGLDNAGEALPIGVYFYEFVHAGGTSEARKAIMLR